MAGTDFEVRGVNHLALVCADMRRTVDFYQGALGFELVMTLDMPGGGQHFFFDVGKGNCLAFFWFPGAPSSVPGVTGPQFLPGKGDITSAVGSMNHIAFDVAPSEIEGYAARLREKGVRCVGPVNHDRSEAGWSAEMHDGVFMRSVYFMDPDGLSLEFASWERSLRPEDALLAPVGAEVTAAAR